MAEKSNNINYLSISELNRLLDKALESSVGQVSFQGELRGELHEQYV